MMMLVGSASNTPEESSAETCIHKKNSESFPKALACPAELSGGRNARTRQKVW